VAVAVAVAVEAAMAVEVEVADGLDGDHGVVDFKTRLWFAMRRGGGVHASAACLSADVGADGRHVSMFV